MGHAARERHAHDAIVTQAWYAAALARAKRLPELARLLMPRGIRVLQGEELEERRREFAELRARMERPAAPAPTPETGARTDHGQGHQAR